MNNPTLRDFLAGLAAHAPEDLWNIDEEVERDFVPTALALALDRAGQSPVLWFERVQGHNIPVVTNVFASRPRLARLLGTDEQGLAEAYLRAERERIAPVVVEEGPVQEMFEKGTEVDVRHLPIARHFEGDAGRYISSGIVVAKDPDTRVPNLSLHRMQLKGPDRLGISLHSRLHLWDYQQRAEQQGQDLEVAVVIGAHPLVYVGSQSRMGIEVDEYGIVGGLFGQAVDLVRCRTVDVEVPARAEIVLEGRILAGVREPEGPFGEYTGYSTSRSTQNVMQVTGISRRRDAIYLDIIPGNSADHLTLMKVSKEPHVWARLKEAVPQVQGINIARSGVSYHCYISMRKTAEGQPRQALMMLFGLDYNIKLAVVVDDDVDITNSDEVLWAMATRMQADRRVFVVPEVFCNRLDPSCVAGMSAKMGIDATAPLDWDVIRCSVPNQAQTRAADLLAGRRN